MPYALPITMSLAIHALVVSVALVGFSPEPYPNIDQPVLTVDIVASADVTNLDEGVEAETPPEAETVPEAPPEAEIVVTEVPPEPAPPPAPEPVPEAPPPPVPAPAPEPIAEAEPVPEALPEPLPEPEPEPEPAVVEAPPPRPVRQVQAPPRRDITQSPAFKAQQRQEQERQEQERLAALNRLQDLTQRAEAQRQREVEQAIEQQKAREQLAELLNKQAERNQEQEQAEQAHAQKDVTNQINQLIGQAFNATQRTDAGLTISQIDALRIHIAQCWSPPPGAAGADSLIVDIIVRFSKNAEVMSVEIKDQTRFRTDASFRAAANAAARAISACGRLPLPPQYIAEFSEIEFKFDPRFITGG